MSEYTERLLAHQTHSIYHFYNQDGEQVSGCVCQVWPDEVDITNGKISHLEPKNEDCPYTSP